MSTFAPTANSVQSQAGNQPILNMGEFQLSGHDEWRECVSRQVCRDKLFELIDRLPDELEHYTDCLPARHMPAGPLFHFLCQGIDLELATRELGPKFGKSWAPNYGSFTPKDAAECLFDHVRTKRFVRAIQANLEDLSSEIAARPIHVVDAGCGPLPILSIAAALFSPDVQVSAYETNPISAEIAREVVKRMGLSSQITIECKSALTAKPSNSIDLLVSETLATCLTRENFCHIMEMLVPHLSPSGLCIPERLTIERGFTRRSPHPENLCSYRAVPTFFTFRQFHDVNFAQCYEWVPGRPHDAPVRIPIDHTYAQFQKGELHEIWLQSRITLYQGRNGKEAIVLNPEDSIITHPFRLRDLFWVHEEIGERLGLEAAGCDSLKADLLYAPGHIATLRLQLFR